MTIKFTDAAKYYKGEPHQFEAFDYLQSNVDSSVIDEFARLYRAKQEQSFLIDKLTLAAIWECSPRLIKDSEVEELNECLHHFDITTPSRIKHFMSQTAHESGGGRWKLELADGWAYEFRSDLGNDMPGDGPKHKGAGYIQLTGKYWHSRLAEAVKDPKCLTIGATYIAQMYPFTSAGLWWRWNKMNQLCDRNPSVADVTLHVNGGYNGLADREHYYRICEKVIKF